MRAIYITRYGEADKAFEIRDAKIPIPGPDEVLIKVKSSGLNFADVVARQGLYPDAPQNPAIIGYDVAGEIWEIGKDVTEFKKGQRVVALTRFGGYAEYAIAKTYGVVVLPNGYDYDLATALATQSCTACYAAIECLNLHEGDKVLVHAASGGVGSALVQIAKSKGCFIIGTASTAKQDYIRSLGVDLAIDYTKEDFHKIIKEKHPEGIDVVFDSIGGKTFKKGMSLLSPAGKMVSYGAASQINGSKPNKLRALRVALGFGFFSPIQLLMGSKSLITVNMLRIADHRPQVFKKVFKKVIQLTEEGVISPRLSKAFKAQDVVQAHKFLESRQSMGKVTLQWE